MLPYLFSIGGFRLPAYGVMVAAAFLTALAVVARLARREGRDADTIVNLGIYCAMAGIAGAKLNLILVDWERYAANPSELFSLATLQAMGIFYGGFLAALAVAIWNMRRKRLPLLATADLFAPGIAIGHAIGRIGCFAAGCCWGTQCDRPWAVTFTNPDAAALTGVPLGVRLHPSQLYESLAEFAIFAYLYWRARRPHAEGAVIGQYLVLYGVTRFLVDYVRNQEQGHPLGGPFTIAQTISLALILLAGAVWWRQRPSLRV